MYEKEPDFVGGLSSSEIPGYRLPYEAVKWEVELAKGKCFQNFFCFGCLYHQIFIY